MAESKAAVVAEGAKEVKRGRGRPKKEVEAKKPEALASPGTSTNGKPADTKSPDISSFIVLPLQTLSKIPAAKHGLPELALSDEEARACAESLNQLLNAFVPSMETMSPKAAAVLGAAMVFGTVGLSKYQIYSQARQDKINSGAIKIPADEVQTENSNLSTIPAENYFRQ